MTKKTPKIYCDTNIFIDYLFNQVNDRGRNVGKEAESVFAKVLMNQYLLVISDFVIEEMRANETINRYIDFERIIANNIIYIKYTMEDKEKAKKLSSENWEDALHVVLAEKGGCKYLITQNIKDFYGLSKEVKVILPSLLPKFS